MLPKLTPLRAGDYCRLNQLSVAQCQTLIEWLHRRIDFLENKYPDEISILSLPINERTCNALLAERLFTVSDLEIFGLNRLQYIRGIGATTAADIRSAVAGVKRRRAEELTIRDEV